MYVVVIEQPDRSRQGYLVFTSNGPIKARDMAEHAAGGRCVKSQEVNHPVITPSVSEIDHIVNQASSIATKTGVQLTAYRFQLRIPGQDSLLTAMVYSTYDIKNAAHFAEQAFMGTVVDRYIVTNPILWDLDAAEQALASG